MQSFLPKFNKFSSFAGRQNIAKGKNHQPVAMLMKKGVKNVMLSTLFLTRLRLENNILFNTVAPDSGSKILFNLAGNSETIWAVQHFSILFYCRLMIFGCVIGNIRIMFNGVSR